jgi:hypothetical protein
LEKITVPTLVDQFGKPIKKEVLMTIFNDGPGAYGFFSSWVRGFVGTYINPDQLSIHNYQEMYDYDDACSSGVDFVTLSVLARLGKYNHPDTRIAAWVNDMIEQREGSLYDDIEEMVSESVKCGFIAGELAYGYDDVGLVTLSDIQFMDPAWIEFDLFSEGPLKNTIKAVKYGGIPLKFNDEPIPMEKFLVFSNGGRYGNPYGRARLKSAYPMYYFKKPCLVGWGITLQKHGTPSRSATISPEGPQTIDLGNGETISIYDFLNQALKTWSNKTDIVLPPGVELVVQSTNMTDKGGFEEAISYADKCIYRALLLPGLVASTAENGMRALGEVHYKMYALGVTRYRNRVVDAIRSQMLRRVISWNFGTQKTYGNFEFKDLDPEAQKMEMEMFASATDKGYIYPERLEDFKHVRSHIGAPEISDEEFKQMRADKQAKAEELQKRLDANRQALEEQQKQKQPQQPTPELQEPKQAAFSRVNGLESFFAEV